VPGSAAKLQITERQQAVLRQIVAAPTSPVRLAQRAEIILRAFQNSSGHTITVSNGAVKIEPEVVLLVLLVLLATMQEGLRGNDRLTSSLLALPYFPHQLFHGLADRRDAPVIDPDLIP
jgi:hypothetical protein